MRADRPLPLELEELTPEWVAAALRVRDPNATVGDIEIVEVIWGSATKVRLRVEHDLSHVPAALCCKTGLVAQLRVIAGAGYANEVHFFEHLADRVPGTPDCYYGAIDAPNGQASLLLEDLVDRGATFGRATTPLTPDEAAGVLELQAEWHARFWGKTDVGVRLTGHENLAQVIDHLMAPAHWDHHLGQRKGDPIRGALRESRKVKAAMLRLWEIDRQSAPTLLHGDTHVGNLWFDADGTPGYLDWQTAMIGPWSHDVATLLGGAMTVDDRRRHERELLGLYLDRLAALGVDDPPRFDDSWLAYRLHLLHGFLWVLTPEEMQPDAITTEMALRFAAAVTDHDTLGTLA